ncbi:MAG: hypothetical protein ABIA66_02700, partial [Candidatus Omnitrophota bacterium]
EHAAHTRLVGGLNPLSATSYLRSQWRKLKRQSCEAGPLSATSYLRSKMAAYIRQSYEARQSYFEVY